MGKFVTYDMTKRTKMPQFPFLLC